MLAVLLVEANKTVSTEQLIDRVWGETPPARVRNVLSGYVSKLRTMVGGRTGDSGVTLTRHSGGYRLAVPPDLVDLHRFRALVARSAGTPLEERYALLGEALALWHGAAFTGLGGRWLDGMREALQRERRTAQSMHAQTALTLGRHAEVVDELTARSGRYPLDEQVAGQLMLALRGTGRPAEALAVYAATRARLTSELGADPGRELQRLYRELLQEDEQRTAGVGRVGENAVAPQSTVGRGVVPRQLPAASVHFTGRDAHLRLLAQQLGRVSRDSPGTVPTAVIHGSAGVGKTTLAVYWAQQVASQFPDGQLFLGLRGFDQNQPPLQSSEALTALLGALDIPPQHIPTTVPEQANLFRSVVAGKQLLIVLDNAATSGQVRPLLPGTRGCMVLITSRNELSGLAAGEGAVRVAVDVLERFDALTLLARIIGRPRTDAEPEAAGALIELCARLPLALRIVADHLITQPDRSLADVLDELTDRQHRLDVLATDEETTTVRAVFALSYHALKPEAARLFRLLGLHEGPQISEPVAAALIDQPLIRVRKLLATLCQGHLLERVGPHRYQFHDLLRLYAAERAGIEESRQELDAVVRRMLTWYLRAATAADRILAPGRFLGQLEQLPASTPALTHANRREAVEWFSEESDNLLAAVRQANSAAEHTIAWQLAWAQHGFFDLCKPWVQWLTTYDIGLASARALGDRAVEAMLLNGIGTAHYYPRHFDLAMSCFRRALHLSVSVDDLHRQACATNSIGNVLLETRQLDAATRHYQQAVKLHEAAGDPRGLAIAQANLAEVSCLVGDFQAALRYAGLALAQYRSSGGLRYEALVLSHAGNALRGLGRLDEAMERYERAVRIASEIRDPQAEGWACHYLAEALYATGRPDQAGLLWKRAIALFDALNDPQANDIRARLAELF